ncbi:LOW QUALITY PROTEIN: follicle-stimulating hormone receptor [Gadus macrocephalus]|uniref:LOW QUALITY PROTEIN: follicle-stimulating hormone receptor n=1 Tax=Gadus macrocephalus TaxID=80720 RepID=UPI0028CB70FC|nr:LOW QUALITY PROTEIN: follicle-stimulating hormone receptor [Gadus macrocephalus]
MRESAPSMRKMALMTMTVMTVMKGAQSCVVQGSGTVECVGGNITEMPSLSPHTTVTLNISQTHIKGLSLETFTNLRHLSKVWIMKNVMLLKIQDFAFANLPALRIIYISENPVLETIGSNAFSNLSALNEIIITKSKHLKSIHSSAFRGLSKLQYLTISNTGLEVFPDFSRILSTTSGFLLVLDENSFLQRVPGNAFRGLCTWTIDEIQLTRNGITEVESDAFNDTQLIRLILTGNHQLTTIHPNAFSGSAGLTLLDVSNTAVRSLPESILEGLETLGAENARQLRTLPPLFGRLRHANLTYHWHCCAFLDSNSKSKWDSICSQPEAHLPINWKFYQTHCTKSCNPQPDALNPCTDIMETSPLRVLIWVISLLALLGNATVLLVLLASRAKLTVPRFLMCHLAFADLCMGVYLVVIAMGDMVTRGQYFNHAIAWQMDYGCNIAGFFTVFASELSVFTLTAITLERWHTITNALRLDRKIRLRHACVVMAAGWVFALLAAALPTLGVSSYDKVSICLPMDVDSLLSQVYVVGLLLLNVLAFLVVCVCYLSIYLAVRKPSSTPAHAADTDVAQRMAVLIFTDFLCMAPISFFAISAALKLPLITMWHAKLLLVLFYPINSCANPFLYAFFTRTFRRDFVLLAARFGLFKAQAQIYRTESSTCQQPAWASPKSSHGTLYSLANISH